MGFQEIEYLSHSVDYIDRYTVDITKISLFKYTRTKN